MRRPADQPAGRIEAILKRGAERGEPVPPLEAVIDHVVAPIVFRLVFRARTPPASFARALVGAVLDGVTRPGTE